MILNRVTCSGPNEFTNIHDLLELMSTFPLGEVAIQVSDRQSPAGGPRLEWIKALAAIVSEQKKHFTAALHVNEKWVEEICRGNVVPELKELLELNNYYREPLFNRLQLNFKIGRNEVPAPEECAKNLRLVQKRIHRPFILSCNESNAALIKKNYLSGLFFECLYDSSFGQGIEPDKRRPPLFYDTKQGYAGGIKPDNVYTTLNAVLEAVNAAPQFVTEVFIDAQKGLEDDAGHFSISKGYAYLATASVWYKQHRMLQN